jgi:hypothetical protein
MILCYTNGQKKSVRICRAFAKGCGGRVMGMEHGLQPGNIFLYGKPALIPLLRQAQAAGRTWWYADNCYLGARNEQFRVTKNARQVDGSGSASPERWKRLGLTIRPWRKNGKHVLVSPPTLDYGELWKLDVVRWRVDVLAELKHSTDRPIIVRERSAMSDPDRPLAADLADCWALVTCASNVAVDALLAGVPVFCTELCGAYSMGTPDLSRIEAPIMRDDREQWAANLAAAQWSIEEMRTGICWAAAQ